MPASLRRPAPLVPAAIVLGLAALQAASARFAPELMGASMSRTGTDYGLEPWDRILIFPGAVFGGADTASLTLEGVFTLATLAVAGWARSRDERDETAEPPAVATFATVAFAHRFALLAFFFVGLYLLFPMSVGGSTLLAHRFLPPAFACLLLAVSPRAGSPSARWLGAVTLLAPLIVVLLMWPMFRAADRRVRDLDLVLASLPDDTSVAQLDLTPRGPGLVAPVPGLAGRAMAMHGGRMLFGFIDQPPYPLFIRPELRWNEPVGRLATMPFAFLPGVDGHRFAYLLVLETEPRVAAMIPDALRPEYEPVRAQGQWQLFRSTLAVDPVASPDRPLTEPPVDTLARRMNRLAQLQQPR